MNSLAHAHTHHRKVDFRELKRLQREEMKEGSEFYARIKIEKDIQEKKFEAEQQVRIA